MVVLYVSGNRIGTWAESEHVVVELARKRQEIELRDEAGPNSHRRTNSLRMSLAAIAELRVL